MSKYSMPNDRIVNEIYELHRNTAKDVDTTMLYTSTDAIKVQRKLNELLSGFFTKVGELVEEGDISERDY